MARLPPGRTNAANELATPGKSFTQFNAPKLEIAPSNGPPICASSSALRTANRRGGPEGVVAGGEVVEDGRTHADSPSHRLELWGSQSWLPPALSRRSPGAKACPWPERAA